MGAVRGHQQKHHPTDPPVSPARTIPGRPLIVSLKCLAYEDPHFSRQLVRPGCKLMPAIPLRRRIGRPFYRRSGDVCAFSPGTTASGISAKQLVGRNRKTLAYLVADFRIVLRHL